jgi:hypothetical protein
MVLLDLNCTPHEEEDGNIYLEEAMSIIMMGASISVKMQVVLLQV